jgi:hypothetical protein
VRRDWDVKPPAAVAQDAPLTREVGLVRFNFNFNFHSVNLPPPHGGCPARCGLCMVHQGTVGQGVQYFDQLAFHTGPFPAAMMTPSTIPVPNAITVVRRLGLTCTRMVRSLIVIALLGLLVACSAIKLAYNNLPDIAYWWIDGYVDTNGTQTLQLRADLERLYDWHRTREMTRIADLLRDMQRIAPADTTADDVCKLISDVRLRLDAVITQAEPGAVALAISLRPEQIKHIESKFNKSNAEWRRDWATGERAERLDKRVKASIERAEQFYGTLDDKQRAVLQAAISRSGFNPELSFLERERRQQDMLKTLRTLGAGNGTAQPSAAQATGALRGYLERLMRSPDLLYRDYAEVALQDNCRAFAELHNSTTAPQRARAIGRLAAYERDAREVAIVR